MDFRINGIHALRHEESESNQRYEARVGFPGYECCVAFRINGIKPIKALPGYEACVGFTGGMNAVRHSPGIDKGHLAQA